MTYAPAADLPCCPVDGKLDIVTMHGGRDGLCWYSIPADPTRPWQRHMIGDGVHGAISPSAVLDIAGHGHADIVRADTWFENKDGKGTQWVAHKNIPFGRVGPFGMCVRTAVVDIDADGKKEIVMLDCDIVECKGAILRNVNGDGRPDICSKPWGPRPWNAAGGKLHVDYLENVTPAGK